MPSRLREARPDITLEAFVLEMVSHGVNTPYALLAQGGLSLGATYKLLNKLLRQKLLSGSQKVAGRKTITFHMTAKGKRRLLEQKNLVLAQKPKTLESALRTAYLAYSSGAAKQAAAVLREFAQSHQNNAKTASTNSPKTTGPELYRWMLASCDAGRRAAESKVLTSLGKRISGNSSRNR